MPRGQSSAAQQARLARQCCPIHGGGLAQVSSWLSFVTQTDHPDDYTLAGCARTDCDVIAKVTHADADDGPATRVTAADVHPELWRQAVAWMDYKRRRGPTR